MQQKEKVEKLAAKIENSRKLLIALGDESRQHLILSMMKMDVDNKGLRAVEIAEHTNLSRPAVSHHLQIMKDAGLICTRKEGTRIYYFFDPQMKTMNALIETLQLAVRITGGSLEG